MAACVGCGRGDGGDDLGRLALEVLGIPGPALVSATPYVVPVTGLVVVGQAPAVTDVVIIGVAQSGEVVQGVERGHLDLGGALLVDQRLVRCVGPGVLEGREIGRAHV